MVESVQVYLLLELPIFVIQKAATPKNGVEFCQKLIDAVTCILATSTSYNEGDILPGSFAFKESEPVKMSPSRLIRIFIIWTHKTYSIQHMHRTAKYAQNMLKTKC